MALVIFLNNIAAKLKEIESKYQKIKDAVMWPVAFVPGSSASIFFFFCRRCCFGVSCIFGGVLLIFVFPSACLLVRLLLLCGWFRVRFAGPGPSRSGGRRAAGPRACFWPLASARSGTGAGAGPGGPAAARRPPGAAGRGKTHVEATRTEPSFFSHIFWHEIGMIKNVKQI